MKPGICRLLLFSSAWTGAALSMAQTAVPLPDHLVYGTIALSGHPVTKANTNIVIEARRPADGQLLASYRMGSAARLGNFLYELRIKVEEPNALSSDIADLGETVNVMVTDTTGVLDQADHQINDSGIAVRLDFGVSVDANQNGVPDGWELAHFGSTIDNLDTDMDGDGISSLSEYISGTDPKVPNDTFRLVVQSVTNQLQVSFQSRAAVGPGYEGRQRFYALETTADLNGSWQEVDSYSRIMGNDQLVTYHPPSSSSNGPVFFRARIWLEGP